jgi:hypothetical protein
MSFITHKPLIIFALAFTGLWLAAWLGASLRKKKPLNSALQQDFSLILAATLTLLGLLIGFSFSMAASRYDQRKNYEEAEANAIGTEYVRADLLPAADATKVRDLLRKYVRQRIGFYTADDTAVAQIDAETAQLQSALWSAVVAPAALQPTPVVALAVSGMNDVLNAQGYTQAAWWNRIPVSAWILMGIIGVCCNSLVGYGSRAATPGNPLLLILPLFVSLAFMLIDDIDTPRHGLIRVAPQNLTSLAASLQPK